MATNKMELNKMEVQTRDANSGIYFWESLGEAMEEAEKDPTIWKISYFNEDGSRTRLIRETDGDGKERWVNRPFIPYNPRKEI